MNEIRIGDCLAIMNLMVLGGIKVQTCITSPPYFGLRDYGTASWDGGDADCDHTGKEPRTAPAGSAKQASNNGNGSVSVASGDCKCGARRIDLQIGLEDTPSAYVERLVEVFRLVRELLAGDGTLWLNLGDSYAGSWRAQGQQNSQSVIARYQIGASHKVSSGTGTIREPGLKPKDLIGIPWRVAFALQADGWYLRSDIIWAKPNPKPESVTDRPTKSHEYIFLLSKSADYFYDAEAIAEPVTDTTIERISQPGLADQVGSFRVPGKTNGGMKAVVKSGDYGNGAGRNDGDRHPAGGWCERPSRNKRTVWTVTTQPYAGAHFATFPPDLILPCVLAGSRPGDVVFDPFMGSGTTALVAKENGRRYLGCELNPAYKALQDERLQQEVLFGPEATA